MKNTLTQPALEDLVQTISQQLAQQGIILGEGQQQALNENLDSFLFEECNVTVTPPE